MSSAIHFLRHRGCFSAHPESRHIPARADAGAPHPRHGRRGACRGATGRSGTASARVYAATTPRRGTRPSAARRGLAAARPSPARGGLPASARDQGAGCRRARERHGRLSASLRAALRKHAPPGLRRGARAHGERRGGPEPEGQVRRARDDARQADGHPGVLVDVRMAASHQEMPALALLRHASERALQWLFERYWHAQSNQLRELRRGAALAEDLVAAEAARRVKAERNVSFRKTQRGKGKAKTRARNGGVHVEDDEKDSEDSESDDDDSAAARTTRRTRTGRTSPTPSPRRARRNATNRLFAAASREDTETCAVALLSVAVGVCRPIDGEAHGSNPANPTLGDWRATAARLLLKRWPTLDEALLLKAAEAALEPGSPSETAADSDARDALRARRRRRRICSRIRRPRIPRRRRRRRNARRKTKTSKRKNQTSTAAARRRTGGSHALRAGARDRVHAYDRRTENVRGKLGEHRAGRRPVVQSRRRARLLGDGPIKKDSGKRFIWKTKTVKRKRSRAPPTKAAAKPTTTTRSSRRRGAAWRRSDGTRRRGGRTAEVSPARAEGRRPAFSQRSRTGPPARWAICPRTCAAISVTPRRRGGRVAARGRAGGTFGRGRGEGWEEEKRNRRLVVGAVASPRRARRRAAARGFRSRVRARDRLRRRRAVRGRDAPRARRPGPRLEGRAGLRPGRSRRRRGRDRLEGSSAVRDRRRRGTRLTRRRRASPRGARRLWCSDPDDDSDTEPMAASPTDLTPTDVSPFPVSKKGIWGRRKRRQRRERSGGGAGGVGEGRRPVRVGTRRPRGFGGGVGDKPAGRGGRRRVRRRYRPTDDDGVAVRVGGVRVRLSASDRNAVAADVECLM